MAEAIQLARLVDTLRQNVVRQHHVEDRRALHCLLERLDDLDGTGRAADAAATLRVRGALDQLAAALLVHLDKEEHILFPALAALADAGRTGAPRPLLPFPSVIHPIRVMERDHQSLRDAVAELVRTASRLRTDGHSGDAWSGWQADLRQFAADLDVHFAVEDRELFPRALELESALP